MIITRQQIARWQSAAPFWLSFALVPLVFISAAYGGWALLLPVVGSWYLFGLLDAVLGVNSDNGDLEATDDELFWYQTLTIAWVPLQFIMVFGLIFYVSNAAHLTGWEKIGVFFGVGIVTGVVGINYSHELMHQSDKIERWLGDVLLGMVLYSHFRSEHLLVHHRYVGTPRDPVTARKGEGFYRFYPRVLKQSFLSALKAERDMLARKQLAGTDVSNPFWRYAALQGGFLILALILGGWVGVGLFLMQAGVAIWQLELVNYVEHYGLTRKHLGGGKYEHVQPRHSWNAAHKASNWLLINLQRHSDHHYKPNRRFPVLQTYDAQEAPQLPYGYTFMCIAAMWPSLWRRIMNPKVQQWRDMYYPEITDWSDYDKASNPLPR